MDIFGNIFTPLNQVKLIRFDSTNYIPVPSNWSTSTDDYAVRQNADVSGQIKIITIRERGAGLGNAQTYSNVPINGGWNRWKGNCCCKC